MGAFNNDECSEFNSVFDVYKEGVGVSKIPLAKLEKQEKRNFGKRGNSHPNLFSTDQRTMCEERYKKLIGLFKQKAFDDNKEAYRLFQQVAMSIIGAPIRPDITFQQRVTTHATREEQKKLFEFFQYCSFYTRFMATNIELAGAVDFQRQFYDLLIQKEKEEPVDGLIELKRKLKALEEDFKSVEQKYEADSLNEDERKVKKRKLTYGKEVRVGLENALEQERTYYNKQLRPVKIKIEQTKQKIQKYRSKRPRKAVYGVKDLPEDKGKDIGLYAVPRPSNGKPFIVELCRRENGMEGFRKNDYLPPRIGQDSEGNIKWHLVKSFPYDDQWTQHRKCDNGTVVEREFPDRRAKALKKAIQYMEAMSTEPEGVVYWETIYPLPGMSAPGSDNLEDVSSVSSSQFRMALGGFQRLANDGSSASNNGGMMMDSTTTTTATDEVRQAQIASADNLPLRNGDGSVSWQADGASNRMNISP